MAEEKREKKKARIIRRILKWVGLAVLSILLILAIVFQAPWKVITLLFIVLAACTILPRRFRKWFWLSAAAVLIALIIWIFLPDDDKGWRPYTFEKELAALEAKYAVPDEENAALIYYELFETMNGDPNEPEFFLRSRPSSKDEPWLSKDHPETAEWLKGYQSTIEKLLQAAKKDNCHFRIPADPWSLGQHMERLSKMRRCTFLLISAANNDIGDGRIDTGLEKYLCIMQMAKHQYQQPALLDFLVGVAIEGLAIRQFRRFVVTGNATEEHLNLIEKAVADIKHDWNGDLPSFIALEKLMLKNTFGMFYEINQKGKVRLTHDPTAAMRKEFPEEITRVAYWQRKLIKTFTILAWFYFPSDPHKAAKMIDATYEKLYKMAEPDYNWQEDPGEIPITFLFSPKRILNYRLLIENLTLSLQRHYYSVHDMYLRTIAQQRGSQLIIALRRYKNKTGHWPESLSDIKSLAPAEILVDPINGDSFVYKLTEDNFTLYSTGKNAIDEAGQYESKWDPNSYEHTVEKDDRLIWPSKSRKIREKKEDAEEQ